MSFGRYLYLNKSIDFACSPTFMNIFYSGNQSENIPVDARSNKSNQSIVIPLTRQFDLDLVWKFATVTERSTSNSSELLMVRTFCRKGSKHFLHCYCAKKIRRPWSSFKVRKVNIRTYSIYWCEEHPCKHDKVSKGSKHSLKSFHANMFSWPWPRVKCYNGHRKVNIKLVQDIDVENIPVVFGKDPSIL